MSAPEVFEVAAEFGSAYYLIPASPSFAAELVQVPLDTEGVPCWEDNADPRFFGGGAVDWERGIESDEDRARLRAIEARLLERMA